MSQRIDPRKMNWVRKPKLSIVTENSVVLETEPYSCFSPTAANEQGPFGLSFEPEGNFQLQLRVDFGFRSFQDQCGLTLYQDDQNWCFFKIESTNSEVHTVSIDINHNGHLDSSRREIGSGIAYLYLKMTRRNDEIRLFDSYNGDHYFLTRAFVLSQPEASLKVYLLACSPMNSYFDCTFSKMRFEHHLKEGDSRL